jgi:rubrerythrin
MATLPADMPSDAVEAFMYLKDRQQLSVEDMQVLAMIECWGEAFYQALASGVANTEARGMLERNAAEERGHAHRLLKAIKLKGGAPFELPAREDNPFMAAVPTDVPCNEEVMSLLEQGEADGDLTYQAWADAEPDAQVAELLRLNGREETRHGERVSAVRQLLTAG